MVFVHGDDVVNTVCGEELRLLEGALERQFEIKSKTIGHDVNDSKVVLVLSHVISLNTSLVKSDLRGRSRSVIHGLVRLIAGVHWTPSISKTPADQCASKHSSERLDLQCAAKK